MVLNIYLAYKYLCFKFDISLLKMSHRISYTAGFKLKVIEYAEKSNNLAASRQFGVNEKLVRDWKKKKDYLNKTNKTVKRHVPCVTPYALMEMTINDWILDLRK